MFLRQHLTGRYVLILFIATSCDIGAKDFGYLIVCIEHSSFESFRLPGPSAGENVPGVSDNRDSCSWLVSFSSREDAIKLITKGAESHRAINRLMAHALQASNE